MRDQGNHDFAHLHSFAHLNGQDIDRAARSLAACAALLEHLEAIAAPSSGVATVLSLFAHLASPACTWLEGDLAVELFEEDDGIRVRVLQELGAGLRERVLPTVTLHAPLSELVDAALDVPQRLGDLRLERISMRCAMLVASPFNTAAVSHFEISNTCLSDAAKASAEPADLADLDWDETTI